MVDTEGIPETSDVIKRKPKRSLKIDSSKHVDVEYSALGEV